MKNIKSIRDAVNLKFQTKRSTCSLKRDSGICAFRRDKTQIDAFCEIVIENFLLPGFKILANSLENTCEGFHFSGSTAGWKHETLQN